MYLARNTRFAPLSDCDFCAGYTNTIWNYWSPIFFVASKARFLLWKQSYVNTVSRPKSFMNENFYSASQHQLPSLVIVLGVILKFLIWWNRNISRTNKRLWIIITIFCGVFQIHLLNNQKVLFALNLIKLHMVNVPYKSNEYLIHEVYQVW